MKRNFVTIFAIALWAVSEEIALSPHYAIAKEVKRERAIASFTSNPITRWTQPGLSIIAQQTPAPKTDTPTDPKAPAGNPGTPPPSPRKSGGARVKQTPSPPDTGDPEGQQTPGGTRSSAKACKQTTQTLTALVPANGKGLTTAEHPVFWFYIPYAPDDVHSIEFSVHDRDEQTTLYRTSLQLTKTPGIIGIPLPPSPEHSLKLNESYHWRLIVNCDHNETSENVLELDGWVTRVQPSPNSVIWYDELTNRAKRYLSEPQNPEVKKAWTELLKSVGLEGLAQAPIVSSSQ